MRGRRGLGCEYGAEPDNDHDHVLSFRLLFVVSCVNPRLRAGGILSVIFNAQLKLAYFGSRQSQLALPAL